MTSLGDVVVVGGEPAALSCAARLLREGVRVAHVYPVPWGLLGASRDIGLAYPELGEPLERLDYALGEELAREFHAWGKSGVELLTQLAGNHQGFRRGSRLQVSRNEQEAKVSGSDALDRQRLGDEVRLMSGGAASNYAPLTTLIVQASFETHAAAFAPVALSEHLQATLARHPNYRAVELSAEPWQQCQVESVSGVARARWPGGEATGDVVMVAAAYDSARLLGKFDKALVPLLGQAFRSQPLREKARSSVVGVTASWGNERYRFDDDWRLLACGIDPSSGQLHHQAVVEDKTQEAFWQRACSIFSDLSLCEEGVLRWGVLFTTTCDGLPLVGPLPGEPHLYVAAGFSTSAWSRGLQVGDQLAGMLTSGGAGTALLQRCSPRRLS